MLEQRCNDAGIKTINTTRRQAYGVQSTCLNYKMNAENSPQGTIVLELHMHTNIASTCPSLCHCVLKWMHHQLSPLVNAMHFFATLSMPLNWEDRKLISVQTRGMMSKPLVFSSIPNTLVLFPRFIKLDLQIKVRPLLVFWMLSKFLVMQDTVQWWLPGRNNS